MSLGNDFLSLVSKLWDIEQFNMWNPKEHSSLAFLLDNLYKTPQYELKYNRMISLADEKNFNEFAWFVSKEIFDLCKSNSIFTEQEMIDLSNMMSWQELDYKENELTGYGIVPDKYIPDWFFEIFHLYINLEEEKRSRIIKEHLTNEYQMNEKKVTASLEKLSKHFDILNEFYFYAKNNRFKNFDSITAEGISAKQLFDTTYLSPLGAYNYLIYLRESPKEALADLEKGLPRK